MNSTPCRSLAELEAAERERTERAQAATQAVAAERERALARRRDEARRQIEFAVLAEREERMALAMALLIAAVVAAAMGVQASEGGNRREAELGFALAGLAFAGSAFAWIDRPPFAEIAERLEDQLREEMTAEDRGTIAAKAQGALVCVLDTERSRVTGTAAQDVPFEWRADGCVNGRTQYGLADGTWSRVLVPADEESVSVNRFDPATREYRMERYLLDREAMARARTARAEFEAPACGGGAEAAQELGARQAAILSLLPERPNERLVYNCRDAS